VAIRYTSSYDQTISFSDTNVIFSLTAGIVQTYTIPGTASDKFSLLFGLSSNASILVGYNATPVAPAANNKSTTQGVEFITPDSKRYAIGGDVISVLCIDATDTMGISLRSIPN